MFKCRNKEERIGLILGCICFMPTFLISIMLFNMYPLIGVILLIISQSLWLISITFCTRSLEIDNRRLRKELEEYKNK